MTRRVVVDAVELAQKRALKKLAGAMRRVARLATYGHTHAEAARLGIPLDSLWARHLEGGTVRPVQGTPSRVVPVPESLHWAFVLRQEGRQHLSARAPGHKTLPPIPAPPGSPEGCEGSGLGLQPPPTGASPATHTPSWTHTWHSGPEAESEAGPAIQAMAQDHALGLVLHGLRVLGSPELRWPDGCRRPVEERAAELRAGLGAPPGVVLGWTAPAPAACYPEQGSGIPFALPGEGAARSLWPVAGPLRECAEGRVIVFRCSDPSCSKEHQAYVGCLRQDCPKCAPAFGQQRAKRLWDRYADLANRWGVAVLTVPPDLRHLVRLKDRRAWSAAAWSTVAEWVRGEGGGQPGQTGGVVYMHPVGSRYVCPDWHAAHLKGAQLPPEHPCAVLGAAVKEEGGHIQHCEGCGQTRISVDSPDWHPHWNVMLPLVRVDDGEGHTLKHWYPRETGALDRLRALWAVQVAKLCRVPVEAVTPQAFWEYRVSAEKIRHAFKYFARGFPGWSRWTTTRGGNAYGALSNRMLPAFRDALGSTLGLVERPAFQWICDCGGAMEFAGLGGAVAWDATPEASRPVEVGRGGMTRAVA